MRSRSIRVTVVREDSQQQQATLRNTSLLGLGTTETTIGGGRRSVGQILELPAYENDVLNALARTGGGKRDQGAHAAEAVVTLARLRRSLA